MSLKISRVWAMPNKQTFSIKPIKELIQRYIDSEKPKIIIDPFANNSCFSHLCHATNDLNPEMNTTHHLEALEFLKLFKDEEIDFLLFDPPWTLRAVSEMYKGVGREVHMEDTQASFYGDRKKEAARVLKQGGIVICAGYNSGGLGKTNGCELEEVMLVPHGGAHYDSIITVERKIKNQEDLF